MKHQRKLARKMFKTLGEYVQTEEGARAAEKACEEARAYVRRIRAERQAGGAE